MFLWPLQPNQCLLCNRLPVQDHHQPLCSRVWRTASATPLSASLHHLHPVCLLRERRGEAVRSRPSTRSPQPQLFSFYCPTGAFYVYGIYGTSHSRRVSCVWVGVHQFVFDLLECFYPHMCFSFEVNAPLDELAGECRWLFISNRGLWRHSPPSSS